MPETWQGFAALHGHVCAFCGKGFSAEEVDDPELIYKEVTSWVHGPKAQGPVLRTQTGRVAHRGCIEKAIDGQAPDQEAIPGLGE